MRGLVNVLLSSVAATQTVLSDGFCPSNAVWSEWRSEAIPTGFSDYEGLSQHTGYRMTHMYNFPPQPRLRCPFLWGVEGRVKSTGAGYTDQTVRFGTITDMDLPTNLNLLPWFTNPRDNDAFSSIDGGLTCWNEEQSSFDPNTYDSSTPICYDYEVRFCCTPVSTELTSLSAGECTSDGTWSEWRNEDGKNGFGDFEGLSWHTSHSFQCSKLLAVEGRVRETGLKMTDQVVRFGIDVNINLPTNLDLSVFNMYNPMDEPNFPSFDSGLVCWNEEQTEWDCHDYEVRWCCDTTANPGIIFYRM